MFSFTCTCISSAMCVVSLALSGTEIIMIIMKKKVFSLPKLGCQCQYPGMIVAYGVNRINCDQNI